MSRCEFCGRFLYKVVSEKYLLCSKQCRSNFKKCNLLELENIILNKVSVNKIQIKLLVKSIPEYDKFQVTSAVRRLIYFKKLVRVVGKDEITLNSFILK